MTNCRGRGKTMTRDEVRKKLKGYNEAKSRYMTAARELEEFNAMIFPKLDYSKQKVKGGKKSDMANIVADIAKLREQCEVEMRTAVSEMIKVKGIIRRVEEARNREILSRRYISSQLWEEIAFEMQIDRRYLFKLHNKALDELAERGEE